KLLKGAHTIKVNGIEMSFTINNIEVAAEGVSAYWSSYTESSLTRILDVGSGTINYATVLEGRYIDKDSSTLSFGVNTNKTNDLSSLARGIATQLSKKWSQSDAVCVVGGVSEEITPYMKEYFPNAEILYPIFN